MDFYGPSFLCRKIFFSSRFQMTKIAKTAFYNPCYYSAAQTVKVIRGELEEEKRLWSGQNMCCHSLWEDAC